MKSWKNILILSLCIVLILMAISALGIGHLTLKLGNNTSTLTLMHIPVIVAALFTGFYGALITGFVFGTASFINAFFSSSGILNQFLKNPLCSILPCILFALFAYYLFSLLQSKFSMKNVFSGLITAFAASVFHSFCMTLSMYIFMYKQILQAMHGHNWFELIKMLMPQILQESFAAVLVVGAIYLFIFIYDIKFKNTSEKNMEI